MSYQEYQKFLKLLKGSPIPFHCSTCTSHSHCQHWITPPCNSVPSKNTEGTAKFKSRRKYPHFTSRKQCCGNKWKPSRKKRTNETAMPVGQSDSDKDRNAGDHDACSDCLTCNVESSSATATPAGSCSEVSGPSGMCRSKQNTSFTKILKVMDKDKKIKEKNCALRKKVVRLEKQLRAHEQANQLLDTNWIEDLIKNYQDILHKFMKLDEKYRTLEKRDGRQHHEKGERLAATQADSAPHDTSVHFEENDNGWGGNQADPGEREQNFPGSDQSTGMSGIGPGNARPPSATTVVIVGGNTTAAAPSNGSRRAARHETVSGDDN